MIKHCPLMAVVPVSLLLTAAFFVLFALRKSTDKWLKALGYSALGLLLFSALTIFLGALVSSCGGPGMRGGMIGEKMGKCGMMRMMPEKDMPAMAVPDMPMQEKKLSPR